MSALGIVSDFECLQADSSPERISSKLIVLAKAIASSRAEFEDAIRCNLVNVVSNFLLVCTKTNESLTKVTVGLLDLRWR